MIGKLHPGVPIPIQFLRVLLDGFLFRLLLWSKGPGMEGGVVPEVFYVPLSIEHLQSSYHCESSSWQQPGLSAVAVSAHINMAPAKAWATNQRGLWEKYRSRRPFQEVQPSKHPIAQSQGDGTAVSFVHLRLSLCKLQAAATPLVMTRSSISRSLFSHLQIWQSLVPPLSPAQGPLLFSAVQWSLSVRFHAA